VLNATLTDELWAALTQRIGAHSMTSFRKLIVALSPKETVEGKAEKVWQGESVLPIAHQFITKKEVENVACEEYTLP
jgi:hypothetical protein